MITKLLPEQIAANWEAIKRVVVRSHPPSVRVSEEVLANILEAAMQMEVQVWIQHESDFEKDLSSVQAVALTAVMTEPISREKTLLIYGLVALDRSGLDWSEGMIALKKFAKSRGCSYVSAYSEVPAVWKIVESFGGNVKTRYLYLEV